MVRGCGPRGIGCGRDCGIDCGREDESTGGSQSTTKKFDDKVLGLAFNFSTLKLWAGYQSLFTTVAYTSK